MAPLGARRAALMVPQPSKILPVLMVIVPAPIDPEAMTDTRYLMLGWTQLR